MTSLLRQLVAGPRARHAEAKLDLCYLTDDIIVTSGPAVTYPSRAYRNPLPRLVSFLTKHHDEEWCIFEFRAEGTGYADEDVSGRIRHFPWPDHHPPPFGVMPPLIESMQLWLGDEQWRTDRPGNVTHVPVGNEEDRKITNDGKLKIEPEKPRKRVAILHCKAGKGRSGTVACSYLISMRGWNVEDALKRFTERRMRPGWGEGISIKSQRRWIGYVERWAAEKRYTERKAKVVEVRIWGRRESVRTLIRGYVDGGKKIKVLHTWAEDEGETVPLEEETKTEEPSASGTGDPRHGQGTLDDANVKQSTSTAKQSTTEQTPSKESSSSQATTAKPASNQSNGGLKKSNSIANRLKKAATPAPKEPSTDGASSSNASPTSSSWSLTASPTLTNPSPNTLTVLRPREPIILGSQDINVEVERRNKSSYGLPTVVTSTAHSWFNTWFEGQGPENGAPDKTGTYTIEWDAMDGLKGSSRRGVRAVDKVSVVWEILDEEEAGREEQIVEAIHEQQGDQIKITVTDSESSTSKIVEGDGGADSEAEEGLQAHGPKGEKKLK